MSTVNKQIADAIIAGEYPEDNWQCILRYENAFNGSFAYKLVNTQGCFTTEEMLKQILYTASRIHIYTAVEIYWCQEYLKEELLKAGVPLTSFVERT